MKQKSNKIVDLVQKGIDIRKIVEKGLQNSFPKVFPEDGSAHAIVFKNKYPKTLKLVEILSSELNEKTIFFAQADVQKSWLSTEKNFVAWADYEGNQVAEFHVMDPGDYEIIEQRQKQADKELEERRKNLRLFESLETAVANDNTVLLKKYFFEIDKKWKQLEKAIKELEEMVSENV